MTEKELARYEVIENLINGKIDGTEASKQVCLSIRQTKRLKASVKKDGAKGVIHKNRGKPSNRRIDDEKMGKAKKLLKEKYADFGPSFAGEKLEELHGIKISKETLRTIMTAEKLWKPKERRQSKNRHEWRARKDNYGEMEQFDGSYHHWMEDRAGEMCLLISIDDAEGKITHARFDYNEGVKAVSSFWMEYFDKNGMPGKIYLDKFSTYKINHKNAVDNSEMMTQFERMMNQVGVELITAHSPEAKGRVERVFGTLQDRMVKEMRLAGVKTIVEANEFLKTYIPKFNKKFAVIPNKKADLHKKVSEELKVKLPQIFSIQNTRKVNNDYTVMFRNSYYQLDLYEQQTSIYKKDVVVMEEHLNGEIKIRLKNHYLKYSVLPERPKKQCEVNLAAITPRKQSGWKPPIDHPWRSSFLVNKSSNIFRKI